jgi:hypothetical protein
MTIQAQVEPSSEKAPSNLNTLHGFKATFSHAASDIGISINDEPKHLNLNPTDSTNAIMIQLYDNDDESLIIPLAYEGVTSYFPIRKPTISEYEQSNIAMPIGLTAKTPEWDPYDNRFQLQEEAMLDPHGIL